jgi:hypothetical protein
MLRHDEQFPVSFLFFANNSNVRPLPDRTVVWRTSPMRNVFEGTMKTQDFAEVAAVYALDGCTLSAARQRRGK